MASFSVVSNIASNTAQANLYGTQVGLQKALTRLSSGFRINVSGDDAAGLAMANSYRSDTAVITQGIRNANDGLSVLQVKDGALGNVSTLLDRLSTLATQAASAGTSGVAVGTLQAEADAILDEIERELDVAGMNAPKDFSVFISNDSKTDVTTHPTFTEASKVTGNTFVLTGLGGKADISLGDGTTAPSHEEIVAELNRVYGSENVAVAGASGSEEYTITTSATTNVGQVKGTLSAISLDAKPASAPADDTTIYLGITDSIDGQGFLRFTDAAASVAAVDTLKGALAGIGDIQGTIGTLQNSLQFAISLSQSQQVNKRAAESRIRDANIAEESANMTRYNILTQSGIAALAQANQSTSAVLSLLR